MTARQETREPSIGERLGARYEWRAVIRSEFGTQLHLAWDPVRRRDVVIRTFSRDLVKAERRLEFSTAMMQLETIDHPGIVPVEDFGIHSGTPFAVSEVRKGESLAEVVDKGGLTPGVALAHVRALGKSLDHLHRAGLVHGHLTPSQVIIDQQGRPILAGLVPVSMATSEWFARQPFASPAVRARDVPRAADDVYALAAVAFYLFTGRPPAALPEERSVATIARALPADMQEERRGTVAAVLATGMHEAAGQRYRTGRDLGKALRSALAGEPAATNVAVPATTARSRGKVRFVAIGAAVAVIAIGIAAVLFPRIEDGSPAVQPLPSDSARGGFVSQSPSINRAPSASPTTPVPPASVAGTGTSAIDTPAAGGTPATADTVVNDVAGARDLSPSPADLATVACSETGWQDFRSAGQGNLFPSEAACRFLFRTSSCPAPAVILEPVALVRESDSLQVAWAAGCGASGYTVEATLGSNPAIKVDVPANAGNSINIGNLPGDASEVHITLLTHLEGGVTTWVHGKHLFTAAP